MKKYVVEFCKRGLVAAWGGPVVVAIVYASIGAAGAVESVAVREMCLAILSSVVMTFIAAGISMIYQVEHLPIAMAALIHAGVLYVDYLLVYLINGWIESQLPTLLVFTAIFVAGFALIWFVVYQFIKKQIRQVNSKLPA